MARPTKRDEALARASQGALTASQVNRLTSEGLGPPDDAPLGDYLEGLAALVGKGRDLDVAAVRLAVEHGWGTERLRRVLSAPVDDDRLSVIFQPLTEKITRGAKAVAEAGTVFRSIGMPDTVDDEAAAIDGAARLELEDLMQGEERCIENFREVASKVVTEPALGGSPAEPDREVYADEFAGYMAAFEQRRREAKDWATTAPMPELVASARVAHALYQHTMAAKLGFGVEDGWRVVAMLAPLAGVLVDLVNDVASQRKG